MSLLPAPDAQDQNSSSANEKPWKFHRTRVPKACKPCHDCKVKCNGASPCQRCQRGRKECVYEDIKPAKEQESLPSLDNSLNTRYKRLRGIHGELGGPDRGRSIIKIDPKRCHGTEAFVSKELRRLSQSYVKNVHALHPFFDKPLEMCNKFINDLAMLKGISSCAENACVLLCFALGSFQSTANSTGSSSPLPGSVYYSYAKDIFKSKLGERNILVAQALTLAALWMIQNGMLHDGFAHLSNARDIYIDIAENTSMSREARRSTWICLNLINGINNCFNWGRFAPVPQRWDKLLQEANVEQFSERVYWTKVSLQNLLDHLHDFRRPYLSTMREIGEETLCNLKHIADKQILMLEKWRCALSSPIAWDDKGPPSTDPLTASLRAEFYGGMAKLLRPYVGIALQTNIHCTEDELSKGQQWILRVVPLWGMCTHFSIVCFDRVGAASDSRYEMYQDPSGNSVMLSNPVDTGHGLFRKVLLLRALRFSAIYRRIAEQTRLTDEDMDKVHRYTIKRLSKFRPSHPILSRDLETLNRVWPLEDPLLWKQLVLAYELI